MSRLSTIGDPIHVPRRHLNLCSPQAPSSSLPRSRLNGSPVLFVADVTAANRVRVRASPRRRPPPRPSRKFASTSSVRKLASLLGVARANDVLIRGIAVHPVSARGITSPSHADAEPRPAQLWCALRPDGELSVVELDDLPFSSFELDDAARPRDDPRMDGWLDGSDESSQPLGRSTVSR